MSNPFKNRVFGCAVIKSINSNYNADFSHQPRILPNGTVYATDKVLKYSVRNYLKNALNEKLFYFKSLTDDMSPRTLDETYEFHFGKGKLDDKKNVRFNVLGDLMSFVDVRLFGGTYAGKTNISIHGACQITHGVNRYAENIIYSEQIMSPFKNSNKDSNESTMTTLGTQSKLQEGHYVHHFTVNPKNIEEDSKRVSSKGLLQNDIEQLKEGLRKGVSYYDSSAKAGTENELLLWVQLKSDSKAVLPSFVELIEINENKEIDLAKISLLLEKPNIQSEIEKVELFYNQGITKIINKPSNAILLDL